MGKLDWSKRSYLAVLLCATSAMVLPAQTFTTLHSFMQSDGAGPQALVQGTDGNLYGTTSSSAPPNYAGTIFKIGVGGTLTTIYRFCSQANCADGSSPSAGPIQASDGNFYGTTSQGGNTVACFSAGCGTVFRVTPSGTLRILHTFDSTDGANPYAGLLQATDGNFYGTTSSGGANGPDGTVFKISPSGGLTTLHSFCSQGASCLDGYFPTAGLVQATDGNFYGTTFSDTIFKITPTGTLTTIYYFCSQARCTDGENPSSALIQGTDGNLYGTTTHGGVWSVGTVFKITLGGKLTTTHSFTVAEGYYPLAGLIQATDGNFYGTTQAGGAYGRGTVFKVTPNGTLTTLHSFNHSDGASPVAALVQDTNGSFYGTTSTGGAHGVGTVFSLSVGLGPFVKTQPTSGKPGQLIKILGTNLTGSKLVTFNGTAAVFKVISNSLITATVPAKATSGEVRVTTSSGRTLSSNVPFRVLP